MTSGVQQSFNSSRACRARALSGASTGGVIRRSLKRDDALSCTGRGHHLQLSGGRRWATTSLARARRVIRTHYRTLFVGLGWSLAAPPQPRIATYAPVVKLHVFVTSGWFARSLIAAVPPRKVTVKLVFARRFAAGVMVTPVNPVASVPPVGVTVAAITPPPVRAIVTVVVVRPTTGLLKVALITGALLVTFVALAAGVVLSTVGAGFATPVVKLNVVPPNAAHVCPSRRMAGTRIPVLGHVPGLITTVYSCVGNKLAF